MKELKKIKKEAKHLRRLKAMQKKIYTVIAPLEVKVHSTKEPIAPGNQRNLEYKPIRRGQIWAGVFGSAWFRIRGVIPKSAQGKHVVVHINVGGEGAIYHDCEPEAGITLVMSYIDRLQASYGKSIIEVSLSAKPDSPLEIYIDAGYNGYYNYPFGFGIFQYAKLCTVDDDLKDYYYDYLTLASLLSITREKHKRNIIEEALNESYSLVKLSVLEAKEVLKPLFNSKSENKEEVRFTAVGHSHLDLAWLWPIRETKRKAQRTFANQINNANKYPSYIYGASQAWQFEYIKENYPKQYTKLQDLAKRGQLELQGGMWVEADTNLSSGEALIRQIFYGKRFFQQEFNQDMKICWLPDVFGYNGNMPQILKKSGLDYFMTIKLSWNEHNRFPYRSFVWQGVDGSQVLVHMSPAETYNSAASPACVKQALKNYSEKEIAPEALLIYGVGDGGGGPGEVHIELAKRQEKLFNSPSVVFGKAIDFFDKLKDYSHKLPLFKDELYLEKHQGTYTTQAKSKNYNRRCEYELQTLESLLVYGWTKGRKYPLSQLDKWWKEVLLYQFHDIIPGSSITRVYRESHIRYEKILKEIKEEEINTFSYLTHMDDKTLSVFNPTSFYREEFVKHDNKWYMAKVEPYGFSQLEKVKQILWEGLSFTDNIIENEYIRLEFSKEGHIVSALDKSTKREFSKGKINALRLYKDKWLYYNAWDIDWKYHKKPSKRLKVKKVTVFYDGPSIIRRSEYRHKKTKLVQDVILFANSPLIYFKSHCDYHETFKMLRADFDLAVDSPFVTCDIQMASIKRSTKDESPEEKAQFEICAHKYVDLSEDSHGVSLINDNKYGHRVKGNRISLNLLRSPIFPDKKADRGESSFTYGLYFHEGGHGLKSLAHSYFLNKPLKIIKGSVDEKSLAATSNPNIVVETIKLSYLQDGIIVRLFNSCDKTISCELTTVFQYKHIIETDLLENEIGPLDLTSLTFTPFEIKTIKLKFELEER